MIRSEQEREEDHNRRHKVNLKHGSICKYLPILFLVIVLVVLALWLSYRPKNPQFVVVGAAVSKVTLSPPLQLSTIMEFTIITRNPNKHVCISYDELIGMVLYKGQQITPQVMLSPVIDEKKSTVEILLVLHGPAVVVTEEVANEIVRSGNEILVRVVLMGRVKWKFGGIKIGYYDVSVKCDVLVNNTKKGLMGPLPLPHSTPCKVDF